MNEAEQYGYRQGAKGDFEQVEFVRWGRSRQSKRVLVRFLAEGQDHAGGVGATARLQVPWADVDQQATRVVTRYDLGLIHPEGVVVLTAKA